MARGVDLVVKRQLGALGQRGVEDGGVGLGQQQTHGVAGGVAHNFAARWLWCVLGVTHGAQRCGIEQGSVIQVQQEHRGIGCHCVDFFQRGQALFHKLVFGKAADHTYPLRCGGVGHLALEHVHGICQRTHAVPAQFQVVVQATANHVGVIVKQAGQCAAALQINLAGAAARQRQYFGIRAHRYKLAILDRYCAGHRLAFVERSELTVMKNNIGCGVGHGGS